MKRRTFNPWRWVIPAASSLILVAPAASGQDIDLDALIWQLDGDEATIAPPLPPQSPPTTETETDIDPETMSARAAPVSRQLPSSFEEVAAYAGRFVDHDVDRTGQMVAHVCSLLETAGVALDPQDTRLCISRPRED